MIKSLLPNARFLTLASESEGRDWLECARKIDSHLDELNMDLADESVFILFDRAPGAVIEGEGSVLIARSVIGPKKQLSGPVKLQDWVQTPVYRKVLQANDWDQILEESFQEWQNLQRQGHGIAAPFMLVAKRRLNPELSLSIEVLFHE